VRMFGRMLPITCTMFFVHQIGIDLVYAVLAAVGGGGALLVFSWMRRLRDGVEESLRQALTDDLTGLGNRRRLLADLERAIAEGTDHSPAVLAMFDLDGFKAYNDTHGHPAGDAAIRHVADALQRGRRETDLAARLGGEEFALLLPGTDRPGAIRAAERIRGELAASPLAQVGTVTVSLGAAIFPEDGTSERELMATADERLYAAKSAGRNRAVV
jgi:two-component system cell cycle response regulator